MRKGRRENGGAAHVWAALEPEFRAVLPVLFGERCASDSENAILERIREELVRSASRMMQSAGLGNVDCDPENAAQDWFLKIRAGRTSYRAGKPIHRYAYTVLRNACLDLRRRGSVRRASPIPIGASSPSPTPDEAAERQDERRCVRRALRVLKQSGAMSQEQRSAIGSKYYRCLRSKEAAKRQGVSPATIDVRTYQARTLLQRELRKGA